ncbi:MAG: cytochrome P450 [Myxococcales bacterium]|nr:cytochrome P450 [Myxococcales bacterium]
MTAPVDAHATAPANVSPVVASARAQPLPPGPHAPALVQLTRYMADPIAFLERCRRELGPVFTLRWPGMPPMVYFTEPAAVQAIFACSPEVLRGGASNAVLDFVTGPRSVARLDGQAHRRRRRGMVPPFGRLGPSYAEAMRSNTLAVLGAYGHRVFSFREASQSLTLDNLIRCALGVRDTARAAQLKALTLDFIAGSLNPVMAALWMLFSGVEVRERIVRHLAPLAHFRATRRLPFVTLARAIEQLDRLLYAAIAEARASDDDGRIDVLSLLVRSEDHRPDLELRDELMTILVGGHETTSTTLDWVLVEACSRPEVMARIRRELDDAVGDGPVTVEALSHLTYLRAVIHECLRLHPPAPAIGRLAAEPVTIAGVDLPAGVMVTPSVVLVHRDATSWSNPRRFVPDRFLDEPIPKGAFIPFGGGSRTCLGKPFAMFQLQVVLGTLLSRFDVEPIDWPAPKLVQRGLFTGVSHPVDLRLRPRSERRHVDPAPPSPRHGSSPCPVC